MDNAASPIDCRGLACPEPVLRAKAALDALDAQGVVTLLVDAEASKENVRRFAEGQGAVVSVTPGANGGWEVSIVKGLPCAPPAPHVSSTAGGAEAFLITSDHLGADPELGRVLMRALLGTLAKAARRPRKLLFLNRGVHLTTEGSDVLDVLRELEAAGVEILSCGTCLDFFHRKDRLHVGRISNMYETAETLSGSEKVVTIS